MEGGPTRRTLILGLNYAPEATGIAPYTAGLAAGLRRRGVQTSVITAHPHYPEWRVHDGYGQWTAHDEQQGVEVTRVRHYVPRHPALTNRMLSEISLGLRQSVRRWRRQDVIVGVSPALFATAIVRLRAAITHPRTPFVVWVQDIYGQGLAETHQGGRLSFRTLHALERRVLRSASRVVVIHERFAARVAREFGIPRDRIDVVRNWSHIDGESVRTVADTRRHLGWRDDEQVVLHAGAMGVKQGLESVIDAARVALHADAGIRFVFLGNGARRDHLRTLAEDLPNVQFIETLPQSEFVDAMNAADVLLVNERPGVAEMAVPSKLTSYFAVGRPVVAATDPTGITAAEVHAADAGVVVDAGDPDALLKAIVDLCGDEERHGRLGRNGRAYQRRVLDAERSITDFWAVLSRSMRKNEARGQVAARAIPTSE